MENRVNRRLLSLRTHPKTAAALLHQHLELANCMPRLGLLNEQQKSIKSVATFPLNYLVPQTSEEGYNHD